MTKNSAILIISFSFALIMSILIGHPAEILAQVRGENSQEFFQEGEQQTQQEIQNLENQQQQQTLERKEEQLDQQLQIDKKNPNAPAVEELPAPPESQNPNLPQSSESEVDVQF